MRTLILVFATSLVKIGETEVTKTMRGRPSNRHGKWVSSAAIDGANGEILLMVTLS